MSKDETTEIQLDFGAGNVAPLPSRCLRVAKTPTDCDICAQACPVSAITPKPLVLPEDEVAETDEAGQQKPSTKAALEKKLGVKIDENCIHCGICVAVCPLEALSTTKHHIKSFEKEVKDKTAETGGLALGCARALFGVSPRLKNNTVSLPCLAALSTEEWFYAATLARDAILDTQDINDTVSDDNRIIGSLKVYLPPLICNDCPINICGDAETNYLAAIAESEAWGADNIELINQAEDLRNAPTGLLASSITDAAANDKREFVEQLAQGFKRSWQSAGNDLSREQSKAEILARRRKRANKMRTPDLNAPRPFGKKSQRRRLLRSALEQEEALAAEIELVCAGTAAKLCDGCGACVDACPLNARRKISSNSVLYFGKLPEKERPQSEQAAVTDLLCCLGCSACVQVCPTSACTLDWLKGKDFLDLRLS